MKKKKGFTLVELLAVIVILALLILIAVPNVIKIMNNAKKNTARDNVLSLVRLAGIYYTSDLSSTLVGEDDSFTCSVTQNGCHEINYDGEEPTGGYIEIKGDGSVNGELTFFDKYTFCIVNGTPEERVCEKVWDGVTASTGLVGEGTESSPYLISSAEDLAYMRNMVNTSTTQTIKGLNADLTDNNKNVFAGTFDGDNHYISGVYINQPTLYYVGLFGYSASAPKTINSYKYPEINNLSLENLYIDGYYGVGAFAGYLKRTAKLSNLINYGTIRGSSHIGGIVGWASKINAKNLYNYGDILYSSGYIGGIMGGGSGSINESINYGNLTVSDDLKEYRNFVSGIAGSFSADVTADNTKLGNYGDIEGNNYIGHIGGVFGRGSCKECFNQGNVTGYNYVAGITALPRASSSTEYYQSTDVYNTGKITCNINCNDFHGDIAVRYINYSNVYSLGMVSNALNDITYFCGLSNNYTCNSEKVYFADAYRSDVNAVLLSEKQFKGVDSDSLLVKLNSENNIYKKVDGFDYPVFNWQNESDLVNPENVSWLDNKVKADYIVLSSVTALSTDTLNNINGILVVISNVKLNDLLNDGWSKITDDANSLISVYWKKVDTGNYSFNVATKVNLTFLSLDNVNSLDLIKLDKFNYKSKTIIDDFEYQVEDKAKYLYALYSKSYLSTNSYFIQKSKLLKSFFNDRNIKIIVLYDNEASSRSKFNFYGLNDYDNNTILQLRIN